MLEPGSILHGRYRIEGLLGHGGMGNVYLATHQELDALVAIKEMHALQLLPTPGAGESYEAQRERARKQFRVEAQILHRLAHPGLPRVHDFFQTDELNYLVMDYVDGSSLQDVLDREGPCPEVQVRAWAGEMCDILHYLHSQREAVVMRDLKPSNIMLRRDGHLSLIDFGLAKVHTGNGKGDTESYVHSAGSPGYAAPEQYGGVSDVRTDIYALGATLYALLSGKAPPQSIEIASGVTTVPPLAALCPHVSTPLASAIERMMRLNRDERPRSIDEVRALLQPDGAATVVTPRAPSTVPVPQRVSRAWWSPLVAAAVVLWWGTRSLGPAQLAVTCNATGAMVFVDERPCGTTPLSAVDVAPGPHRIRLQKEGYEAYAIERTLRRGRNEISVSLVASVGPTLYLQVSPEQSTVKVNGTSQGKYGEETKKVVLPAGACTLEILHEGYKPHLERIDPGKEFPIPYSVTLQPKAVSLSVTLPHAGHLLINGEMKGKLPRTTVLAPGKYTIATDVPGYEAQEVELKPAHDLSVALTRSVRTTPKPAGVATTTVVSVVTPYPTNTAFVSHAPASGNDTPSVSHRAGPPQGPAPVLDTSTLIVPGERLGPIRLGAPVSDYAALMNRAQWQRDGRDFYDGHNDRGNLLIVAQNGRVVAAGGPGAVAYQLEGGLRVNAPMTQLYGQLGQPVRRNAPLLNMVDRGSNWEIFSSGLAVQVWQGNIGTIVVLDRSLAQ